jgi:O-phosphoseryl-tRNA(Cys) synthetase
LLITCEDEDKLRQFPGLAQELYDTCRYLIFLNIKEVGVDKDFVNTVEDASNDFDLIGSTIKVC